MEARIALTCGHWTLIERAEGKRNQTSRKHKEKKTAELLLNYPTTKEGATHHASTKTS